MVVQSHVAQQRLLQIFTAGESMGFEYIGNAPVEALDHAVGLGRAWFGQAMLNVQSLAQLIKFMIARGLALTACKQPVGELLAVVGQYFLHPHRASLVQSVEKRACSSGRLVALDLHKHPACCTVNGHKQIAPTGFVGHLGQVFDIDVNEPGLVTFERFVGRRRLFGLELIEIANTVPAQAAVNPRSARLRAKKFASDRQQVVQGQEQHLPELNDDLFLRRRERGLQPVWGVRCIVKTVSPLPLVNGALTNAIALSQSHGRVGAGRNLRSGGGRGACVFVQGDHHYKAPG